MFKKFLLFLLFLVDILAFMFCILSFINPLILEIFFLPVFSVEIRIAVLIISLSLIGILGGIYRTQKEKVDFNEFGVRKRNAKQKLSSVNRQYIDAYKLAETERIVSKAALDNATHKGSKNPEEDLKKLIGLKEAKQVINKMKSRMDFERESRKKSKNAKKEPLHMVFYGSPGTGKTTVARIVAGFLYDYGYIKYNKVFEADGNFLKSRTASDTEQKVKMILSHIKGGVLFIDEAYALTQSNDASGKQAIATLIKEMEDRPDDFVAIFAGYTDEMQQMLNTNPGFRSRIKEYVYFPDYDAGDLREIAITMAGNKGFSISADAFFNFDRRMQIEHSIPSWGNARTVRNVIEESINNHAYNYESGIHDKKDKYILTEEDIEINPPKRI